MVKVLISDDNIHYATHLMNSINENSNNVRVIGIAQNGLETMQKIKCSINRATTQMYYQCEIERLKKYFHFCIDKKPNVKTIINTIINKI